VLGTQKLCAWYTETLRHSHEVVLKCVGRYLLGMRDCGLIMDPIDVLNIEMFVDADFAGLWGAEDRTDPISLRSHTGFVIFNVKCPIIWVSKLQMGTAVSTFRLHCPIYSNT
jgi:hypothetical protein